MAANISDCVIKTLGEHGEKLSVTGNSISDAASLIRHMDSVHGRGFRDVNIGAQRVRVTYATRTIVVSSPYASALADLIGGNPLDQPDPEGRVLTELRCYGGAVRVWLEAGFDVVIKSYPLGHPFFTLRRTNADGSFDFVADFGYTLDGRRAWHFTTDRGSEFHHRAPRHFMAAEAQEGIDRAIVAFRQKGLEG